MGKNTGGSAFPSTQDQWERGMEGMTLRDWFAGQALVGSMSIPYPDGQTITPESIIYDVALCYTYADAMLAERSKE